MLHFQHKVIVILLCFMNPYDVIEQQIVTIARRQALMGEARLAHHDDVQLTYFAVHTKFRHLSFLCVSLLVNSGRARPPYRRYG